MAGKDLLKGIKLATDEINQNQSISGYLVNLSISDDGGDPEKALSLFEQMQSEKIPIIIGSYTTSLTLPMAEKTKNSDQTILISPQANGEDLYGISPQFFSDKPTYILSCSILLQNGLDILQIEQQLCILMMNMGDLF